MNRIAWRDGVAISSVLVTKKVVGACSTTIRGFSEALNFHFIFSL